VKRPSQFADWIEELTTAAASAAAPPRRSSTARPTRTTAARWRCSSQRRWDWFCTEDGCDSDISSPPRREHAGRHADCRGLVTAALRVAEPGWSRP